MRNSKRILAVIAAPLLVGNGCEVVDLRPQMRDVVYGLGTADSSPLDPLRRNEYPQWPKATREAVDNRVVLIGMNKSQVQLATRLPENFILKNTVNTSAGPTEIWTIWKTLIGWDYAKSDGFRVWIRFVNGTVTAITRE